MMFGLLPGDLQTTTEITFLESYTGTERSFAIEEDGVCPTCQGNPRQYIRRCAECGGTGTVRSKRRIAVTIPAGVEDGMHVRAKDQGGKIGTKGKRGHLYVTVHVKPDTHYSRQGAHLYMEGCK